jgi:flavin reductase (DIM6/NTAB) family NADH-FMN oxidoreductase RutF
MEYTPSKSDHGLPFNPFSACIVPRPIGWVSTISKDGRPNLAPFSFFNGVGYNPPTIVVCPNGPHSEGGEKDTPVNISATGEFVVNLATYPLRDRLNVTGHSHPRSVDEFEAAGLTKAPSRVVRPPRVAESPVHLECRLIQEVLLPSTTAHPLRAIFGEVVHIHIDDEVIVDGRVSIERLDPLARLGYQDYCRIGEIFEMPLPEFSRLLYGDAPEDQR